MKTGGNSKEEKITKSVRSNVTATKHNHATHFILEAKP